MVEVPTDFTKEVVRYVVESSRDHARRRIE